jgi:hypothetical protein
MAAQKDILVVDFHGNVFLTAGASQIYMDNTGTKMDGSGAEPFKFRIADVHVSQSQDKKYEASGALGERALRGSGSFPAHECLSAGGPCIPAGPDIHLLSQARRAVTDD